MLYLRAKLYFFNIKNIGFINIWGNINLISKKYYSETLITTRRKIILFYFGHIVRINMKS